MKKIILLSVLVLLLIPSPASAFVAEPLSVKIDSDGMGFTLNGPPGKYWIISTHCNGMQEAGSYSGGPLHIDVPPEGPWGPIAHVTVDSLNGIGGHADDSRSCGGSKGRNLFKMWLLMRGDEGCILLSETHPSVERQQTLCFPTSDPDWTADRVACVGYVTSEDYWPCDSFGFSRLPLRSESGPNLMKVWHRHKARQQE